MFSTPGIIKFFWPKDNVETKYNSIYDIPIIDINKRLTKLDPSIHQNFLLFHIGDLMPKENIAKLQKIYKSKVLILPDQNTQANFEDIQKVYPDALGKMVVNGQDAHPFTKFLKKKAIQLYDYDMFGAKKTIPFGVFKKQGDKISYYSQQRIKELVSQLEKQQ